MFPPLPTTSTCVIDIAIGMPERMSLDEAGDRLRSAGWRAPAAVGDHWASVFTAAGVRAAITHLFTAQQWPEEHVRLFADWLRAHDGDRDHYASLKRNLVARGIWDSACTEHKAAFVLQIVNRAWAARGLEAVAGPL